MLALSGQSGIQPGSANDHGATRISSSSDGARDRVHPTLLRTADQSPNSSIKVHAYVKQGTDLSAYMPDALARAWVSPDGITIVSGTVRGRNIVKMANEDGVIAVDPMRGAYQPALAPDSELGKRFTPDADTAASMYEAIHSGERGTALASVEGNPDPAGWADILGTHNSKLAWEKGFTGAGVKVMVNDSGIDFGHPDLYGTWATIDDPNSPYYGWPQQMDAYSMFLFARDMILGESNIASGAGHYADTSTVVTEDAASYQPLDADEPRDFTLTGTSQSGEYRIGTHPDTSLRPWYFLATGQEPPGDDEENGEAEEGQRPAILVVDENQAGVYDTVYVDLDFDGDFSDEQPVTRDNPVSCADWWGAYDPATEDFDPTPDGLCDISAGLVYWISDGVNPVPAADWWWGLGVAGNGQQDDGEPGAGDLVLFSVNDFAQSPAGEHGQLVASNIAAQGVIDGDSMEMVLEGDPVAGIRPDYKPADAGGMVQAAGRDVKLVNGGDFYSFGGLDAHVMAAVGYDGIPGTADDIQIINDSWGSSVLHNDGWDVISRVIDALTRPVNPTLLVVVAVGNGAPGFGTVASPAPPNGLMVGASTQHGSTGWDSATGADQITHGDVASFSGRGPGARGDSGVHVLGSGSRASGDVSPNQSMSGAHAWTTWGGTSRAAPVVAGNAALMYQAFLETYGFWPSYEAARMLLMSGATDIGADPLLQGAGTVNASRTIDLVTGAGGVFVWPWEYRPGDYEGENYPGFANVMEPGERHEQWFEIANPSGQTAHLQVTDQWLQKVGEWEQEWTSAPISQEPIEIDPEDPSETDFDWNRPHYLWDVTEHIPEDADTVVFRINYDFDSFDPAGSYSWDQTNTFQLISYDWTDVNGDGDLWNDANGNGVVDEGELDVGEYVRLEYANQRANTMYVTVQRPHERVHDGIFLGLQHNQAREDVPQTPMTVGMDFYQQVDMPWIEIGQRGELSVPPLSTGRIEVEVEVPGNAPAGVYSAAVVVSLGDRNTIVPVPITVVSNRQNMKAGTREDNPHPSEGLYNQDQVYGAQSWRWREEAGDWRFYYTDLSEQAGNLSDRMPDGSIFYLTDVQWENLNTDVDVHVLSPALDDFSAEDPSYYGPYTLAEAGSSNIAYLGDGVYALDTSSGHNREVIAVPYRPGLNGLLLHNTNFAGVEPAEAISVQTGLLGVSENPIVVSGGAARSTIPQTLISTMQLSGIEVRGFGLSAPVIEQGLAIQQDNPDDPSTSSYTQEFTLENAGLLDIQVIGGENDDIDLFLLQDLNGDGEFDFESETIASSTTPTAEERINIQLPEDGDYMLAVHGWAVPGGESTFDLSLLAVQGENISTTNVPEGQINPNRPYDFTVDVDTEGLTAGRYAGVLTIGPPEGPSAVIVFIDYTIE